jgi:hypothetical protein
LPSIVTRLRRTDHPCGGHGSDSGVSRNLRNLFRRLGIRLKTSFGERSQRQMMEDVDVL